MSSRPREPSVGNLSCRGVMLALLASPACVEAAETIELKFDWGPELIVLRDVETTMGPIQPDVRPALPTAPMAPGPAVAPLTGVTPLPATPAAPVMRPGSVGVRYRVAAKQQADGAYEIRVIDLLVRAGGGDMLIPGEPSTRQVIDSVAPAIKLDARGAFVALLEPEQVASRFKTMPKVFEDRIKALPPEQQPQAKAQFDEMRSVEYLSARAAFPWFESVGFWVGRRLEFGHTYTETAEERFMPISTSLGPVRVERRWSAAGRAPCDEPTATVEPAASMKAEPSVGGPAADCVRLSLRSTFTPLRPPAHALVEGKQDLRYESEMDLVTEPATLRPRRALVISRSRWRGATGAEESMDALRYRMRWTYGPPALVALKGTIPTPPGLGMPPAEPANLKPKPEWALGTPERAYVDFRSAMTSGDWPTAVGLMHPEFLTRVAKRIRGREGAEKSDELRNALVGADVTVEQIGAMSDLALVLLVTKRLADEQRNAGFSWDRPLSFGPGRVVLGHVEDRERRIHVVTQTDSEYQMPVEYRGSSSNVVLSLENYPSTPGGGSNAGTAPMTCEPARDAHRCWRIWRDPNAEYEPISRVQNQLARRRREAGGTVPPAVPPSAAPSPGKPAVPAP